MSDFLQRLAARHLESPDIRPRAASRFETVAPSAGSWATSDASRPVAITHDITRDGPPRTIANRADAMSGDDAAAWDALASARREPSADTTRVDRMNRMDRMPHGDGPVADRSRLEASRAPLDATVQRARADDARTASADAPDRKRATPDEHARDAATLAPRSAPAITPRAIAALGGDTAHASFRHAPDAARALEAPDVVHVHIGRVEVRAVMAAPERGRPPAARDTARPLSLDRYLARKDRP